MPHHLERLHWSEFVTRYDTDRTLFYLDPPYYGCEDDYGAELFARDQFDLMAFHLGNIAGKFVLSLNAHAEVRRIFARFAQVEVEVTYTVGGGDKAQRTTELIISNVDQARLAELVRE